MDERLTAITTPPLDASPEQRAGLRTMTQRRSRVIRSLVTVTIVTIGMLVLALAQRDQQAIRQCRAQVDRTIARLRHDQAAGHVPTTLHDPSTDDPNAPDHFAYNPLYAQLRRNTPLVGVACCAEPHQLYLRSAGRHLIVFDGKDFRSEWVREDQLAARLETLAFSRFLLREY
ncbi:MAG: hypothetical protein U1D55_18600 [Phycisphaerae bacterium]